MRKNKTTFAEQLQLMTKNDLISFGKSISLKLKKSILKEEMAYQLVTYIFEHPQTFLSKMSQDHLLLFQEMIHSPENEAHISLIKPNDDLLFSLGLTNYVVTKTCIIEFIPDEIKEVMLPWIDDEVNKIKHSIRHERETLLLGLINLYGIVDIDTLYTAAKNYDSTISMSSIYDLIEESIILKSIYNEVVKMFISLKIENLNMLLVETHERDLPFDTSYSKAEVMSLGRMCCPIPLCKEADNLKQLYSKKGLSDNDINCFLSRLWLDSNNSDNFSFLIENYELIEGLYQLDVDLQDYSDAVSSYLNATPKWILRGCTPNKLFNAANRRQSPPQITVGPNMKKAGIDFNQADFDNLWNEANANNTSKVGRNESCPCGSGKKYKQCCGNN